jgi:hypothetical protein
MTKYLAKSLAWGAFILGFWFLATVIERIWFTATSVAVPQVEERSASAPLQPTPEAGSSTVVASAPAVISPTPAPTVAAEVKAVSVPTQVEQNIGVSEEKPVKKTSATKPMDSTPSGRSPQASKAQQQASAQASPTPKPQKANDDVADEVVKKVVPQVADDLVKKLF